MKIPKTALTLPNIDNNLKPAARMSDVELSTWFAFCNALKFINIGEHNYNEEIQEKDIPYSAILNYTQTVSGDIVQHLKSKHGIPMKYSLNVDAVEARQIDEIEYYID